MSTLSTLTVKLIGDAGGLNSTLSGAAQSVQQAGQRMSQVGGTLTTRVTAPIVGIGAAAVLMGNQFNGGMANVISLVPEAADEIAGMSGGVQQLAVDMGASTTDMTTGLYQVVSAFGLSGESLDLLGTNAMAAAAGLATTEEAIALTSAVTKGYGDTTAEAVQHAADLALKTVQLGQTTFPELASSIGAVTPLAAALNVSQAELFGVMATGTGVTGGASEVATQFRGVLQSLMAPTDAMTAAFEELGVTSGEQLIDIYGLEDGLHNIMMIAEDSGQPLQAYIGSIEGQTLAMALAGPQADTWAEKTQALRDAAGTTQAAFEAQTQGVNANGFAMQQAAIQMQVTAQQLGQALQPAITTIMPFVEQLIGWVQGLVTRFTELDPKTQMIILGVVGFAAALGPLLLVLGPIVSGIGAVGVVLGAVLSPIGLIVVAVAALALAFATDFGGIRTTVVGIWDEHLKPIFETLKLWLETNIPIALGILAGVWENTLKPAIETVWAFIQTYIFPLIETLVNVWFAALKIELAVLAGIWENVLKPALETVWEFIQNNIIPIFETVVQWLAENIPPAIEDLARFWEETLLPAIETVWEFIETYIIPLFEELVSIYIANVQEALQTLGEFWEETLLPAIETVWEFIDEKIIPIFRQLVDTYIDDLKTALTEMNRIWEEHVLPALHDVWDFLTTKVAPAFVDLKAKLDGPVGTALRVIQGVIDGVAGALGGLRDAAQWVIDKLGALADAINNLPSLPALWNPGSPTPAEVGFRGIASALNELTPLMEDFGGAVNDLDVGNLNEVGDALSVFSDAIQVVTDLASFGEYLPSIGPAAEHVVNQMKGLMRKLWRVSAEIAAEMGPEALAEAAATGKLLSDVMSPWVKAIEAIDKIKLFESSKIGEQAEEIAQKMMGLARKLARVFRELGPQVMAEAAAAGQQFKDALEPWKEAVDVIGALADFTPQTIGPAIDGLLLMLEELGDIGVKTGSGWLEGIIAGIESQMPALAAVLAQIGQMFIRPFEPGGDLDPAARWDPAARLQPVGRQDPTARRDAGGGPVTINISGPWYIREEADIEKLALAVSEALGRRASVNRRLNVGWAIE